MTDEKAKLNRKLYLAAKRLSESCGDNYGSEAADNGECFQHYSDDAKYKLDKVLVEFEKQMKRVKRGSRGVSRCRALAPLHSWERFP